MIPRRFVIIFILVPGSFVGWLKIAFLRFGSGVDQVPPHPYPLPKEREPRCQAPSQSRRDLMRTGEGSPSPWGEGRGEGELDRRQNRISEMQSSTPTETVRHVLRERR